jgi:hypothetical protein
MAKNIPYNKHPKGIFPIAIVTIMQKVEIVKKLLIKSILWVGMIAHAH